MGLISSINFKQSKDFQPFHNANIRPNYAIGGEIICNINGYQAIELKKQIIDTAKKKYENKFNQPFKAKSYEWSAVVNLKEDSSMSDLENLAKHLEAKYGFQCYQIAIHRDEGHIDENGKTQINHHAHLEFITLDKETGKNRQRELKPSVLRQMQSEVAEILKMERGVDKRLSGAKRIEPRAYAKIVNEIKEQAKSQERISEKELKAIKEQARKEMIKEGGFTKEDYKTLRELSGAEYETKESIIEAMRKIKAEREQDKIKIKNLSESLNLDKLEIQEFKKTRGIDLETQKYLRDKVEALQNEKDALNRDLEAEKKKIQELEAENIKLKAELEKKTQEPAKSQEPIQEENNENTEFISDFLADAQERAELLKPKAEANIDAKLDNEISANNANEANFNYFELKALELKNTKQTKEAFKEQFKQYASQKMNADELKVLVAILHKNPSKLNNEHKELIKESLALAQTNNTAYSHMDNAYKAFIRTNLGQTIGTQSVRDVMNLFSNPKSAFDKAVAKDSMSFTINKIKELNRSSLAPETITKLNDIQRGKTLSRGFER